MKRTLLVIGDTMMSETRNEPSLSRFLAYKAALNKRGIGFILISYDDVLHKRLPNIVAKKVKIILFFPYNYWNDNIERYDKDNRIYGDMKFGKEYRDFFIRVSRILRYRYRDKRLSFVNPPESCALDRDKVLTYKIFKKAGILTPHLYAVRSVSQIDRLLQGGRYLYIKPRFGAMGKGITCLNRNGCRTNFLYKNGRIISHRYDYNWKTASISGKNRKRFLQILINNGFLFQEGIDVPLVRGRRFDMRVYVVNNKVPYLYAKSAPRSSFITNWSQGGRIEKKAFLRRALSRKALDGVKSAARKAVKELGLNFAGVDVIVNKDKSRTYLLEVQSFPGYERGFDLMKFLADEV